MVWLFTLRAVNKNGAPPGSCIPRPVKPTSDSGGRPFVSSVWLFTLRAVNQNGAQPGSCIPRPVKPPSDFWRKIFHVFGLALHSKSGEIFLFPPKFPPLLRPWLTTASRFEVAPPPCVFGAMSRSSSRFRSSRSAGLVVFFVLTTPSLRPWLATASRFSVAPPPSVFGARSSSFVDWNRLDRRDLSCSSCSRHRCFVLG